MSAQIISTTAPLLLLSLCLFVVLVGSIHYVSSRQFEALDAPNLDDLVSLVGPPPTPYLPWLAFIVSLALLPFISYKSATIGLHEVLAYEEAANSLASAQAQLAGLEHDIENRRAALSREAQTRREAMSWWSRQADRAGGVFQDKDPALERLQEEADQMEQAVRESRKAIPDPPKDKSNERVVAAILAGVALRGVCAWLITVHWRDCRRWRDAGVAALYEMRKEEATKKAAREQQEARAVEAARIQLAEAEARERTRLAEAEARERTRRESLRLEREKAIAKLDEKSLRGAIVKITGNETIEGYHLKLGKSLSVEADSRSRAEFRLAVEAARADDRNNAIVQLAAYRDGTLWQGRACQISPTTLRATRPQKLVLRDAVLDGSNVARWRSDEMPGNGKFDTEAIIQVVELLRDEGCNASVVIDGPDGRLWRSFSGASKFEESTEVRVCETNVQADYLIIRTAIERCAIIVSNDNFFDYEEAWFVPKRKGAIHRDKILLSKIRPSHAIRWPSKSQEVKGASLPGDDDSGSPRP